MRYRDFIAILIALFSEFALASSGITYYGRILKSDGSPLLSQSVQFHGWTLVSKTNGSGNDHVGSVATNLTNMSSNSTSTSGYIGDSARLLIGQHYRINGSCGTNLYFKITNTLSFSVWWNNPNTGCTVSTSYNSDPNTYSTSCADDAGATGYTVGPAYSGRNWGRPGDGYQGTGIPNACGTYGNFGAAMYVK